MSKIQLVNHRGAASTAIMRQLFRREDRIKTLKLNIFSIELKINHPARGDWSC